ncbi:MAG: hypothetical protein E6I52_15930 [Chloroflexi bacterium]|nr:MAG: hypothetical protein E6I52_15930 [Chloroflexota bacterium]
MPQEPSYVAQLGSVLRRRDAAVLREFLVRSAERFGDSRQVADVQAKSPEEMEELLHRMIVARPDLKDLQRASREWLFRHGIDAYGEEGQRRN